MKPSRLAKRDPTTGIAGRCARAANGIAAAPPSAAINLPRLMSILKLKDGILAA
jgi:hypothetical protein